MNHNHQVHSPRFDWEHHFPIGGEQPGYAPQFVLSAPSSSSGKTTLTLGILRALQRRGLGVQPFKCGPDYIDPLHHQKACGRQSVNLDTFLSSASHVQAVYAKYAAEAQVTVIEGVMGLFDGSVKMEGSTASIAELLKVPVVMVVDARSMAYSAAPLLYGFKNFYKGITLAGVIFNFVNTDSHYQFLKDACADIGLRSLGYLPKNESFNIPSRHLGLHLPQENDFTNSLDVLAQQIEKTIDLNGLLESSQRPSPLPPARRAQVVAADRIIAVAKDAAFSFTYAENIERLAEYGRIQCFSPLEDAEIPRCDFLYLPGGYPELYAAELEENHSMRRSIRAYCQAGGLTYAECGGMMYLGQSIHLALGPSKSMAGVFDFSTSMENSRVALGYRHLSGADWQVRGHEFHYSRLNSNPPGELAPGDVATAQALDHFVITTARGKEVTTPIYRFRNCFATYLHLYWGESDHFIKYLFEQSHDMEYVTKDPETL
ncbi:cobyrinic acid a,c-diamide synthase [Dyadobacter jejuensis]|uniref:Cobyrinate a,c-diamide synthase n=1 Tax=Dyadobacter jejuensis TaxID=1082580 RepID=A0A316AC85_9BACT|nr:cobyrinate a,c-diamide synthase [Dyadobacter jejuensis]PWJ55029.1 cobyrinic acid a,c-diamide synthase [Dyadobacter jejuensis]